jgi:hypothetical protein
MYITASVTWDYNSDLCILQPLSHEIKAVTYVYYSQIKTVTYITASVLWDFNSDLCVLQPLSHEITTSSEEVMTEIPQQNIEVEAVNDITEQTIIQG